MMIGGDKEAVERLDPIFKALAPGSGDIPRTPGREGRDPRVERGYMHCGPSGAGHFVKMIHNGIEYGLMQAYAEGFDILHRANIESCPKSSVSTSTCPTSPKCGGAAASSAPGCSISRRSRWPKIRTLAHYSGFVEDSGEGRWTIKAAIEEAVPADVLSAALYARFRSRKEHTFADKLLSAMRTGFGGHLEARRRCRCSKAEQHAWRGTGHRSPAVPAPRHLRRHGRPDAAPADAGALQSCAQPGCCRRTSASSAWPATDDQRRLARRPDHGSANHATRQVRRRDRDRLSLRRLHRR